MLTWERIFPGGDFAEAVLTRPLLLKNIRLKTHKSDSASIDANPTDICIVTSLTPRWSVKTTHHLANYHGMKLTQGLLGEFLANTVYQLTLK